jgi:2-C-methyl-D-erythritol 4-phosphate cytidylyltransferase
MASDPADELWCVVVAAGSGTRFGGAKQHAELHGSTVLQRSLATARAVCDGVVVVVPAGAAEPGRPEGVGALDVPEPIDGADAVVVGGATRSASVANGLVAVPARASVVLVHDAARPLATPALFARVAEAVRSGADAAVPVVTVIDTIRDVGGGTVDRDRLRAVQTPQGFRASVLRSVHSGPADATDDAALVEAAGGAVVLVEGERANLKITEPSDLHVAATLLDLAGQAVVTDPAAGTVTDLAAGAGVGGGAAECDSAPGGGGDSVP